ncbi:cytochrome c family protein [Novosphingobium sp. PASSN1]|uniref:c-type cytochrome n=1 Tax=Novosphingobium sp. PASSN1 TaxID=2015561 RepID=UPI000BDA6C22|nr:cytochrome c family protein [Novosphingobium sp. PASSN1]OYU36240.1 MAG: cytochrome c family protein [Novosphingobium sp. PASSN1]
MRNLRGYLGLIALSAALAACGGKKEEAAAPAAEAPAAAAPAADAAAPAAAKIAADDVTTVDGTKFADMKGDAAAGEKIFTQCKTCHVIDAGVNRIGPSLHGIIGRKAGQVAGFSYSSANKESGITWTAEKLYQYLEKPARVVPGTKMAFAGLAKGQDRADVIAYLTSATK